MSIIISRAYIYAASWTNEWINAMLHARLSCVYQSTYLLTYLFVFSRDKVIKLFMSLLWWPRGRRYPVVWLSGQHRDRRTELRVVSLSMDHHRTSRSTSQHISHRLRTRPPPAVDRLVAWARLRFHRPGGRVSFARRRWRLPCLRQDLWERCFDFRHHGQFSCIFQLFLLIFPLICKPYERLYWLFCSTVFFCWPTVVIIL